MVQHVLKALAVGWSPPKPLPHLKPLASALDGSLFAYGDDGFDPTRVENQTLPLVKMSLEEIHSHFQLPQPKDC